MIQDLNYQKISKPHEKNNDDYASVSILIHDEKEIIFIKRSEDLPTHKGHIAFPGGKKEVEDQSIVDTALREACEELLIDLKTITPIGILKPIDTVEYKFEVYPVVCLISDKPSSFNKSEVQNLYYVPIQELEKEKIGSFVDTTIVIGFLTLMEKFCGEQQQKWLEIYLILLTKHFLLHLLQLNTKI